MFLYQEKFNNSHNKYSNCFINNHSFCNIYRVYRLILSEWFKLRNLREKPQFISHQPFLTTHFTNAPFNRAKALYTCNWYLTFYERNLHRRPRCARGPQPHAEQLRRARQHREFAPLMTEKLLYTRSLLNYGDKNGCITKSTDN
jgi:hypothetical protein